MEMVLIIIPIAYYLLRECEAAYKAAMWLYRRRRKAQESTET
jgi:hypothetical protein